MTTETPNKRINKAITLEEKLAILKELEAGASRRDVEEIFKCSQSTISRVLLSREALLQMAESDKAVNGIYDPAMYNREIDEPLTDWAQKRTYNGEAITPDMVKLKAEELSKEIGQEFIYSSHWLYKWKDRKNIRFTKKPVDTKDAEGEGRGNKEILKGLLGKGKEDETKEQKLKKIRLENNEQNGLNLKRYNEKPLETETLNTSLDLSYKARPKREYIRRMPAFMKTAGGSQYPGTIYRSRKEKTFLTLLQKLEILQRLKNGERRPDLIIEYKLSQSAMSQIVSDEEKIQKLAAGGQNLQMKRVRGGIFKDGEAELNSWVKNKMQMGESLTRTQIKNKAKEIADRLNIDFKASTGWLEKWKARMNLDFNENQILHRKVPSYINNENEAKQNESAEFSDELNDNELLFPDLVKQEILEDDDEEDNDDYDQIPNENDSSFNDSLASNVKTEYLTPQEFYMQTLQKDKQQQEEQLPPDPVQLAEEPEDIKPFVSTPPHLMPVPEYQEETLQEKLLKWCHKYKVSRAAAEDLFKILQPHLNSIIKPPKTSTPLAKKHRYT